jgi:hypothetical protein
VCCNTQDVENARIEVPGCVETSRDLEKMEIAIPRPFDFHDFDTTRFDVDR